MQEGSSSPTETAPQRVSWFQAQVTRDVLEGLRRIAKHEDRSMSAAFRQMVRDRVAALDAEDEAAA